MTPAMTPRTTGWRRRRSIGPLTLPAGFSMSGVAPPPTPPPTPPAHRTTRDRRNVSRVVRRARQLGWWGRSGRDRCRHDDDLFAVDEDHLGWTVLRRPA